MRITFVNVGYGDAILMESDTGYTALLDGGGNLPQEKYDPKTDHKIYDPKALTKDKITKEEYRRCRKPIGIGSLVGVIIGATPALAAVWRRLLLTIRSSRRPSTRKRSARVRSRAWLLRNLPTTALAVQL